MKKKLLVTDLDNTLFDWVEIWYQSFSAMLEELINTSGVSRDTLIAEIRQVHQRHGTSEYAFLIEEVPSLKTFCGDRDPLEVYETAIYAYRKARKSNLELYPHVITTLDEIRSRGTMVVAYTESMAFYTGYRVRKLNLDGRIDVLFSPADHDLPAGLDLTTIRRYPAESYDFLNTRHEYTPSGTLKPNIEVLRSIISSTGVQEHEAVYVGDSLQKDVIMAQRGGIDNAWAKYGQAQQRPEYELLREVTHWTDEDVERERQIKAVDVNPTIVLENSFSEIFEHFEFGGDQ